MRIAFRVSAASAGRMAAAAKGILETDPSADITLITSGVPPLSIEGMEQVDIGEQSHPSWDLEYTENAVPEGTDMLVLDNHPDVKFQKAMKRKASMLAVMDDEAGLPDYFADALINPAVHSHTLDYRCAGGEILIGTEFYPLGPEFDDFLDHGMEPDERCRKISVRLGHDRKGLTLAAIRLLKRIDSNFLAAVSLPQGSAQGEAVAREIGLDDRFIVADDDPRRFSDADLAIASGATFHEFVFFRIPAVLADAESWPLLSDYSAKAGICAPLDISGNDPAPLRRLMEDSEKRKRMSLRMTDLVDGLGRFRLGEELLRIYRDKF